MNDAEQVLEALQDIYCAQCNHLKALHHETNPTWVERHKTKATAHEKDKGCSVCDCDCFRAEEPVDSVWCGATEDVICVYHGCSK